MQRQRSTHTALAGPHPASACSYRSSRLCHGGMNQRVSSQELQGWSLTCKFMPRHSSDKPCLQRSQTFTPCLSKNPDSNPRAGPRQSEGGRQAQDSVKGGGGAPPFLPASSIACCSCSNFSCIRPLTSQLIGQLESLASSRQLRRVKSHWQNTTGPCLHSSGFSQPVRPWITVCAVAKSSCTRQLEAMRLCLPNYKFDIASQAGC
jgi:hypothetical protein